MTGNRLPSPLALLLILLFAAGASRGVAEAQNPTAVQRLALSAFGGVSGIYTGLSSGRNLGLTAGADLALPPYHGVRPGIEVRGTYPIASGQVVGEKSVLGGLRADFYFGHRIHPYGDFLIGRGQMNYGADHIYNDFDYVLTTTYVYSPGAGIDLDLSDRLAIKADAQFQRWGSTPTASGTVYSKAGTLAVVYRFNFNGNRRR